MNDPIAIDDADTETYEEIPWSHLVEELGTRRHNLPLIVGGVLVVGALVGFLTARLASTGPGQASSAAAVSSTVAAPALAPTTSAPSIPTSTVTTLDPAAVLYAEADLMAVASDLEQTIAAARAEWFVRDFFTVDGASGPSDQVAEVLSAHGVTRPDDITTYVEWARTLTVEPVGPRRYDTTVVFALLVADGDVFVRQPAAAVRLTVAVDESLASAVTGLPQPAAVGYATIEPPAADDTPPPSGVLETASLRALRFGDDPSRLRSWFETGTWHIVMSVHHGGAAWPLLVDVRDPGSDP